MKYFVHEKGLCESSDIGDDTKIWAFTHILPGAKIGAGCNICDLVFVEGDVIIGDRVTVKCGVKLWNGLRVGHDVFIGPDASFCNDPFPRSKVYPESRPQTVIENGASIGANAVILPGLRIGRGAMIGAGAVVTRDVPANAVVCGNPARITGYCGQNPPARLGAEVVSPSLALGGGGRPATLGVGGCALMPLPSFKDLRGTLVAVEFEKVPFVPRRHFFVYDVRGDKVRGEHAHRECRQFLTAVRGSLNVVLNDGRSAREVRLDAPEYGLLIEPMVWAVQYKFSSDAVLSVYASHSYDNEDYIRDFNMFLEAVTGLQGASDAHNAV